MLNDSLQLTVVMLTEFRQCFPLSQSKCRVVSPNLANPTFLNDVSYDVARKDH